MSNRSLLGRKSTYTEATQSTDDWRMNATLNALENSGYCKFCNRPLPIEARSNRMFCNRKCCQDWYNREQRSWNKPAPRKVKADFEPTDLNSFYINEDERREGRKQL